MEEKSNADEWRSSFRFCHSHSISPLLLQVNRRRCRRNHIPFSLSQLFYFLFLHHYLHTLELNSNEPIYFYIVVLVVRLWWILGLIRKLSPTPCCLNRIDTPCSSQRVITGYTSKKKKKYQRFNLYTYIAFLNNIAKVVLLNNDNARQHKTGKSLA